ncbi:MAG: hypothetical protein ACK4ZD_02015 [Caldimonas sp.]|uniref:hypothetical protein n=1 Tax=Caldimonas sp. TaxID=2838790 RepID=UPI00391CFE9C
MDRRTHRLQIATRIHFALLRELGSGIDVGLMLSRELYALDVLNVCRASENEELERLAEQFVQASAPRPLVPPPPTRSTPAPRPRRAWWRSLGAALGASRPGGPLTLGAQ